MSAIHYNSKVFPSMEIVTDALLIKGDYGSSHLMSLNVFQSQTRKMSLLHVSYTKLVGSSPTELRESLSCYARPRVLRSLQYPQKFRDFLQPLTISQQHFTVFMISCLALVSLVKTVAYSVGELLQMCRGWEDGIVFILSSDFVYVLTIVKMPVCKPQRYFIFPDAKVFCLQPTLTLTWISCTLDLQVIVSNGVK